MLFVESLTDRLAALVVKDVSSVTELHREDETSRAAAKTLREQSVLSARAEAAIAIRRAQTVRQERGER